MKKPFVYLVGAGPGDAELITLKGLRCLSEAECVIYDGLVNPSLLDYAPPAAEKIAVAKRGGRDSIPQEQINDLLIHHAMLGKTVVRLKGGDPTIFARASEEVRTLQKAGIGFEIVPGITAGVAAAEYTGIFLTDRDISSQVLFVTGHPAADKDFEDIDWDFAARFRGSLVLYMAMGSLDKIARRLISAGKFPDTPAVVIQNATLPDQKFAKGTLENIAGVCESQNISAPAVVILGKAAQSDPAGQWFMKKPLFGKTIVITRDIIGNLRLEQLLLRQAANVINFPCIELQGPIESSPLKHAIRDLGDYDWIVFTSSHGVEFMFQSLQKAGKDSRAFGSAKIACIGDRTAEALSQYGLCADFVPTKFTAQSLAEELAAQYDLRRKNILLLRSAIASNELADNLRQKNAAIEDIRIYTAVPLTQDEAKKQELVDLIQTGRVDWITFTSSSTVDGFLQNVDIEIIRQANVKLASIGPETTKKLESLGLNAGLEAAPHTAEGLAETLRTTN
ncbi:MAG: uroporphyrinogen-III C-methyltransferase [Planctomycetes bacterium]|nr:uroporphyrinogen-III C-methyltransferase [Planctomycetota bacterium]